MFDPYTLKRERQVAMSKVFGAAYGKQPANDKTHDEMLKLLYKID